MSANNKIDVKCLQNFHLRLTSRGTLEATFASEKDDVDLDENDS